MALWPLVLCLALPCVSHGSAIAAHSTVSKSTDCITYPFRGGMRHAAFMAFASVRPLSTECPQQLLSAIASLLHPSDRNCSGWYLFVAYVYLHDAAYAYLPNAHISPPEEVHKTCTTFLVLNSRERNKGKNLSQAVQCDYVFTVE